ncbi:MAG TPA: permease [Burkholderiales bacterium]|nr:permease [Burkholderiales bacterium]
MRPAGLRLEQAPPIAVPFRFFLTAPAFLLAAAAVLAWAGPDALAWRGSPAALAATHFVTLGFMTMVMVGAMLQMLPVLAGAPVPHVRPAATLVHAGLALGTAALGLGFLFGQPVLMKAAAWLLGAAFAVFVAAAAAALGRAAVRNATVRGAAVAVASLVVTVALGLMLAATYGWGVPLANLAVRALHPAWGLLGWTGLLVAAVAFQVVPMFQMTPQYPPRMTRWFTAGAFTALVAWSLAAWYASGSPVDLALSLVLAAGYALFAVTTLVLQYRRRRRLPDATTAFWQLGMACALAACVGWAARLAAPDAPQALDVAIGVLALAGFAVSVIAGMLYKIVPFLAWFHLQASVGPRRAPHMKKILSDAAQRAHFGLHATAVALLLAAIVWPRPLVRVAGLALALSALVLLRNLLQAARRYRAEPAGGPDAGRTPAGRPIGQRQA